VENHGSISAMGDIHDFLEEQGKKAALKGGGFDRREVEAAAAYLSDEENAISFLYSGWSSAGLPHRRLPDTQSWQLRSGAVGLIVQPGARMGPGRDPIPVGIPYGSRARLIMIYLQSEAIRTQRRDLELGRSMRVWMGRLGVPIGGDSMTAVRDQCERIAHCHITFHLHDGMVRQNVVEAGFFEKPKDGDRQTFLKEAVLSEGFFEQLKKHPVPLEDAAIEQINNNSMALDVYAWLAYRLHSLKGPRVVPWLALSEQFGAGFTLLKNFRVTFLDNLKLAMAVYPKAKVTLEDNGLVLHPSPPPVSKLLI
jgi:hypothetical protein